MYKRCGYKREQGEGRQKRRRRSREGQVQRTPRIIENTRAGRAVNFCYPCSSWNYWKCPRMKLLSDTSFTQERKQDAPLNLFCKTIAQLPLLLFPPFLLFLLEEAATSKRLIDQIAVISNSNSYKYNARRTCNNPLTSDNTSTDCHIVFVWIWTRWIKNYLRLCNYFLQRNLNVLESWILLVQFHGIGKNRKSSPLLSSQDGFDSRIPSCQSVPSRDRATSYVTAINHRSINNRPL